MRPCALLLSGGLSLYQLPQCRVLSIEGTGETVWGHSGTALPFQVLALLTLFSAGAQQSMMTISSHTLKLSLCNGHFCSHNGCNLKQLYAYLANCLYRTASHTLLLWQTASVGQWPQWPWLCQWSASCSHGSYVLFKRVLIGLILCMCVHAGLRRPQSFSLFTGLGLEVTAACFSHATSLVSLKNNFILNLLWSNNYVVLFFEWTCLKVSTGISHALRKECGRNLKHKYNSTPYPWILFLWFQLPAVNQVSKLLDGKFQK